MYRNKVMLDVDLSIFWALTLVLHGLAILCKKKKIVNSESGARSGYVSDAWC